MCAAGLRPAWWAAPEVGPTRIDAVADVDPGTVVCVQRPHPRCLMRREDREREAGLRQHLERLVVDGGFREPHPFGVAAEAQAKVFDAPAHLRGLVAA